MMSQAIPQLDYFVNKLRPQFQNARIIAFDPGETVGWALMEAGKILQSGQVRTTEFTKAQIDELKALISPMTPTLVAYESYRVYSWKTDDHAWNEVHTAQIIGIIRSECLEYSIPYVMQTAQVAKQFVTDEKLIAWGLWKKGEKHARDAIRHAVYATLFGKQDQLYGPEGALEK